MNNLTLAVLSGVFLLMSSQGIAQDDRTFWQKLFGKKSEQIDVAEPKNSQDSLAVLLNNHLGEGSNNTAATTTDSNIQITDSSINPSIKGEGYINILVDQNIADWLDSAKVADPIGFRIQVFMGDLTEARSIKSSMLGSGERATLDYNSSDYYVRIGDFRNYISAEKKLNTIKKLYPSAYVVKDRIKLN